jgi:predicted permease
VILVIMSVSALKHAFILYLSRSFMNDMHSLVHMLWCLSIFTYIFGNANVAKISDYTLSVLNYLYFPHSYRVITKAVTKESKIPHFRNSSKI